MWIDTFIPYGPEQRLADAYNRSMSLAKSDWVLLLDHDVYLATNPMWYKICVECTDKASVDIGMLTCVTYKRNGFDLDVRHSDDIEQNMLYADRIYDKYKYEVEDVENHRRAGFFMLIRKHAWKNIGGFEDQGKGVNKIDHDFCKRLIQAGWKIKIMKGLYTYHRKHRNRK